MVTFEENTQGEWVVLLFCSSKLGGDAHGDGKEVNFTWGEGEIYCKALGNFISILAN